MSRTREQTARTFSTLTVILGAVLIVQAASALLVAFVDGAISIDPLMVIAFLIPPLAQIGIGIATMLLARRRLMLALKIALFGMLAVDLLQGTGLVIVWAMFVPDALDVQSAIAAYVPLSEFVLVGTDWYGGIGYAVGGIFWAVTFWSSIALGAVGLKAARKDFA